ncbi:MAG: response regulator transcription factor [Nitrospirae bacterium]|nr:response regulator transcription factor [Nitrospirota bacterium]
MTRVFLVDDHALVREGIRRILSDAEDITLVGEAATATEALERAGGLNVDVVVLDLSLPDRHGLEVLKDLRAAARTPSVLVLSMHAEHQYAVRAFKAGASGYLTKQAAPEELIDAIRTIASGRKYVTQAAAQRLAAAVAGDRHALPHQALSDREMEVMMMLVRGNGISDIAAQLQLSPKTITTHRARILSKMGMSNNADLVRYSLEHKLME